MLLDIWKPLLLTVSVLIIINCIWTLLFTSCYIFSRRKQKWIELLQFLGKVSPCVYNFLPIRCHIASLSLRNFTYRKLHFGKNNEKTRGWSLIGKQYTHILLCFFPPLNILLFVLFGIRVSCMWPILISRIKWAWIANSVLYDNHVLVFKYKLLVL